MKNRIDFSEEMKEMMKGWKGKFLKSYIENDKDGYVTIVRFLINNQIFDIDNDYVLYVEPDGENVEFSCFSCVEQQQNVSLQTSVVGGKCKEYIVGEQIENVFIVKEIERDIYPNDEEVYEFSYEQALIIQAKNHFYVLWRHLIFNTMEMAKCDNLDDALTAIKELNDGEVMPSDEPCPTVIIDKTVEKL